MNKEKKKQILQSMHDLTKFVDKLNALIMTTGDGIKGTQILKYLMMKYVSDLCVEEYEKRNGKEKLEEARKAFEDFQRLTNAKIKKFDTLEELEKYQENKDNRDSDKSVTADS